jgi:hypothetical protein
MQKMFVPLLAWYAKKAKLECGSLWHLLRAALIVQSIVGIIKLWRLNEVIRENGHGVGLEHQ